jgi:hypothetical protein
VNDVQSDPGSFRDSQGRVYYADEKIFRIVTTGGVEVFNLVPDKGLIERLRSNGRVSESGRALSWFRRSE